MKNTVQRDKLTETVNSKFSALNYRIVKETSTCVDSDAILSAIVNAAILEVSYVVAMSYRKLLCSCKL